MQVVFLDAAQIELDDSVAYYNHEVRGLGLDFLNEVLRTIDLIVSHPDAWPQLSERTRRCQVNRFPFSVIYQIRDNQILVVAIAHLHRKPEYWNNRIK